MKLSVYALYIESKGSLGVYLDDERYDDFYEKNFLGYPMLKDWESPPLTIEGENLPLKDVIAGVSMAPLVSERTKEALAPLIGKYVEFLPAITIKQMNYFYLNVIELVDCLDIEKSQISYVSDASKDILHVFQFSFVPSKVRSIPIFKVPQDTRVIFVQNDFVDLVIDNAITGIGVENPSRLTYMKEHVSANPSLPIPLQQSERRNIKDKSVLANVESIVPKNLAYNEVPWLLTPCIDVVNNFSDGSYEQKENSMLQIVPKKLGYYYLIYRFDTLWGNGGMQAVALGEDILSVGTLLEKTAEAMSHYGFPEKESCIKEVAQISKQVRDEIDKLDKCHAEDEEFERLWRKIDDFDFQYRLADKGKDIYEFILKDLRQYPNEYVYKNCRFPGTHDLTQT